MAAFVEKPSPRKAKRYLAAGGYAWNSGIFILSAKRVMSEMARRLPALHRGLLRIERSLGKRTERKTLRETFPRLPAVSIDFGLMEAAAREGAVASLPCRVGWSDIGDFGALGDLLSGPSGKSVVVGEHIGVDSGNLIVHAPGKLVATVGVKDLIVVDAGDAMLICARSQAQDVRKVVEALKRKRLDRYL